MWMRMNEFQGSPNQSDQEIEQLTQISREFLPRLQQQTGFKGVITVGDRSSGKGITLTFWENEEAMSASEEAANKLRHEGAQETGQEIAGVERFEVYVSEPPQE